MKTTAEEELYKFICNKTNDKFYREKNLSRLHIIANGKEKASDEERGRACYYFALSMQQFGTNSSCLYYPNAFGKNLEPRSEINGKYDDLYFLSVEKIVKKYWMYGRDLYEDKDCAVELINLEFKTATDLPTQLKHLEDLAELANSGNEKAVSYLIDHCDHIGVIAALWRLSATTKNTGISKSISTLIATKIKSLEQDALLKRSYNANTLAWLHFLQEIIEKKNNFECKEKEKKEKSEEEPQYINQVYYFIRSFTSLMFVNHPEKESIFHALIHNTEKYELLKKNEVFSDAQKKLFKQIVPPAKIPSDLKAVETINKITAYTYNTLLNKDKDQYFELGVAFGTIIMVRYQLSPAFN